MSDENKNNIDLSCLTSEEIESLMKQSKKVPGLESFNAAENLFPPEEENKEEENKEDEDK